MVDLRLATPEDVEELVDVQQSGAVLGLANVFPQDAHPFPRDAIAARWLEEIADPATHVWLCSDPGGHLTGFAATRGDELLHFGTAPAAWGSGLAAQLHDAVLATFARDDGGPARLRLRVFEENRRARRFYERLGWRATGRRSRSPFAPHPELLEYEHPKRSAMR